MKFLNKRPLMKIIYRLFLAFFCLGHSFSQQSGTSPVKVFLLAGQSNMQGYGWVTPDQTALDKNGGTGTLDYLLANTGPNDEYDKLADTNGDWKIRDDVWIKYDTRASGDWKATQFGNLTVGYGSSTNHIGPEFMWGHVLGDALENQILLIKLAVGGTAFIANLDSALGGPWASPSSGGSTVSIDLYSALVDTAHKVLQNIAAYFPDYNGQGYEIAGVGWNQGWNDRNNATLYPTFLANFLRDLRTEFKVPNLPMVVAETGNVCPAGTGNRGAFCDSQMVVADWDEFKGTVAAIRTKQYLTTTPESPRYQISHWYQNAESYYNIGKAMGEAMLGLLPPDTGSTRIEGYRSNNPFDVRLHRNHESVRIKLSKPDNYLLVIRNLRGNKIGEFQFDKSEFLFSVSNLPMGIYTFQIHSDNQFWTRKWVYTK